MKVTLEVDPKDMREMMRLSGEKRRSSAVAKFLLTSLQLSRRKEVLDKFLSGEWSTEGVMGAEKKSQWAGS